MADKKVLYDIGACKQELFSSFINDPDICELLFNKKAYTDDDRENLFYSQIFPYLYVGDEDEVAQTKTLSYLCYEVEPEFDTGTIKKMRLIVWAYCHKDIMRYNKKGYYGTRVDILADMVERKLRDSYDFGIGKPELISVKHFFPNTQYYGRVLIYDVPDFKFKG